MATPASIIRYSVIVPAYNAAHTISNCLEALNRQTIPAEQYEIIVIDDGSTDNTGEISGTFGARVLRQPQNRGQAAGRNWGIREAIGEIICFTDADCTPEPDWLAEVTAPLRENPQIAGCKGIYRTRQQELTARFVQLEYEDKYDRLRQYRRISFVDTYSAAYRRDVLVALNGFDERFPVAEDRELSYRVAAAGHEMVFQPSAVVRHIHANTPHSYFFKKVLNGYWGGQAVGHFPERQKEDSYTPQTMKVQVGLMGLLLATAVLTPVLPILIPAALLVLIAFVATTLPFVLKALHKDPVVAFVAPNFLALRALALGIGYGWRLVRPMPQMLQVPSEP